MAQEALESWILFIVEKDDARRLDVIDFFVLSVFYFSFEIYRTR